MRFPKPRRGVPVNRLWAKRYKLATPMAERSFTQSERELLRHLTSLVAERARGEAALDEHAAEVRRRAERDHQQAVSAAGADLAGAQGAALAELRRRQEQIKAEHDARLAAAKKRMEKHLNTHAARTVTIGKAATAEVEESKWLAETLVESGQIKIRGEYEVTRKAVEKRLAEVAALRQMADELLEQYRFEKLPPSAPASEAAAGPLGDKDTLAKSFEEARGAASAKLQALDQRIRPVLLRTPAVLAGMILAAVLVGGGVWYANHATPPERIGTAGGVGAIVVGGLMLALRLVSRRKVPAAARTVAEALDEAAAAGERCLVRAQMDRDQAGVELLAKRDSDLSAAEKKFATAKRVVARRQQVESPRLRDRHSRRLADIRKRAERYAADAEEGHRRRLEEAQGRHDSVVGEATRRRDETLRELEEQDRRGRQAVRRAWLEGMAGMYAELERLKGAVAARPWGDAGWERLTPSAEVPAGVSFGSLAVDMATLPGGLSSDPGMAAPGPTVIEIPAVVDVLDRGSLLINAGPEARAQAVDLLKGVMLRILAAFPPGKVRFTIIDPVGLGQNFAGFMHLADFDEALVNGKIWSEPRHIEQRLTDLTEHMETVIQKYLRNEFATIQEYNERAGEVAEPYRFLVIADFPTNLTEAAAKRLASIATSGARCGVYTLVASTASQTREGRPRVPAWVPMAALEASSAVLAWNGSRLVWQNDDFSAWPLTIEQAPAEDRITSLVNQVGALAKDASRVQVPFEAVAPRAEQLWSQESAHEVRVPLGRAGAKNLQYFTLGRGTAQHALIAGRTGSGKSTLLHVLITNLALWYSPDEIEMYLVDFKKGVEFKTYASHELPHARVIAVESEREFGLSVLRRLDAELTRRGQLFREAGAQDVAGYRRIMAARASEAGGTAARPLTIPRILLIVDEFQEFFVEDDKLAQEASLLLDRLVRQGRAFGMHIVLGSQTLGGAYSIARSTIGQMAVRIALQCSEADSYLIMAEDNAAARLLSRPGEAIYNDVSGRLEGNSPFQIVWLPDEKREGYLARARAKVEANGHIPPPAIVFEGNIPADISRNHPLALLLERKAAPGPVPRVFLGEPISIKEATAAVFRRQTGSNLLIAGQQEDGAVAAAVSSVVSLGAQLAGDAALPPVLVLDGTPADSPHAGLIEGLAAKLPRLLRVGRAREAGGMLEALCAELDRREAQEGAGGPARFLIVLGLQRFRDLRKEDEYSFGGSDEPAASPAKRFARILRDGPAQGIHTIVWCDSVTNIERSLDRNSLREFELRLLFQMSAADSTTLIDTPAAATLGRYRALLHSEESGVVEKFRPYAVPDPAWLAGAVEKIAGLIRES